MSKSLEQKFEQAKNLTEMLVKKSCIQSDRYYFVLRRFQDLRLKINENKKINIGVANNSRCYFDNPELMVTSGTYMRAKTSLEKQIKNRFINR